MEKVNYYVVVHSVEEISNDSVYKICDKFYYESYFDAVEKFESLIGWYLFHGFLHGSFNNECLLCGSSSCRRVTLKNNSKSYLISFYDFTK